MRILVIDDSSTLRAIARKDLALGGYEIVQAASGQEGLDIVKSMPIDLITLDVEMPGLNGYETFKALRSEKFARELGVRCEIPVIFLTANDSLAEREQGFLHGAAEYITKPFLPGELLEAVDRVLRPGYKYSRLTALIADDSSVVRSIISDSLKTLGMKVEQAADGDSLLKIYRKRMNEIDLVITDYVMPGLNGQEVCKKIRGELNQKTTPIIVLSGFSERVDVLDLFKAGATDYLSKPFVKEELLARVEVHLTLRLLNQQLTSKIHKLKKLSRLKDDFLAICSHDLRGPLASINGLAALIAERELTAGEMADCADQIVTASDFLLSLIGELLDLSRIQSENEELELAPIDVTEVVRASLRALHTLYSAKKQTLEFASAASNGSKILGNASALIRIVNNLLTNAVKFTPPNGKIRVEIGPSGNKTISLAVIDSGIGIARDKLPHLFAKFSKASRPGTEGEKGSGLGLPIVKELVERLHGSIEVSSEEGRGSNFRVAFPIYSTVQ